MLKYEVITETTSYFEWIILSVVDTLCKTVSLSFLRRFFSCLTYCNNFSEPRVNYLTMIIKKNNNLLLRWYWLMNQDTMVIFENFGHFYNILFISIGRLSLGKKTAVLVNWGSCAIAVLWEPLAPLSSWRRVDTLVLSQQSREIKITNM